MDCILKAQYIRKTKLNYKFGRSALVSAKDWTVMNCYFVDCSATRECYNKYGMRLVDNNGNDVTAQETRDYFLIEMICENARRYYGEGGEYPRLQSSVFRFYTAEEANLWVKQMLHDKILSDWKRVK